MKSRSILFAALAVVAALWVTPKPARGGELFEVSQGGPGNGTGTIGAFSTSGAAVNISLISGLNTPVGIAASGKDIFVVNYGTYDKSGAYIHGSGTIGEYTTSGATVNSSLVSGLDAPKSIAVYGANLFVTNSLAGTIGEYTTSGTTVNASLVKGLSDPEGIAASDGNLFVVNHHIGTVGKYTTSGATVNASLIPGLATYHDPWAIAISGTSLFIASLSAGTIGEYTTSGATVNDSLISNGLNVPYAIAVFGENIFSTNGNANISEYTTSGATVSVRLLSQTIPTGPNGIAVIPEPSTWALLAMGAGALLLGRRRR